MRGQVDREHVATVVREVPRLQRPHAMIVARAVHEHERRLRRDEGARPGIRVHLVAVDEQAHYDA